MFNFGKCSSNGVHNISVSSKLIGGSSSFFCGTGGSFVSTFSKKFPPMADDGSSSSSFDSAAKGWCWTHLMRDGHVVTTNAEAHIAVQASTRGISTKEQYIVFLFDILVDKRQVKSVKRR